MSDNPPSAPRRAAIALILLILAAAGLRAGLRWRAEQPSEARFTPDQPTGLTFDFRGAAEDASLDPETAFRVRSLCPRIEHAHFKPGAEGFGIVSLTGSGFDRVSVVSARAGGPIAESRPHLEEDGRLRFAAGCRDCSFVLGMVVEGVTVGCEGPGFSVALEGGRVTAGR